MEPAIEGPFLGQSALCEPILRSLPLWFGIEPAIAQYVKDIEGMPTLLARQGKEVAGFLTLKEHNPYAAEVHVMGVLAEWHRHGLGQALLRAAEAYLVERGFEYLQVKTLSSIHPSPEYARTRAFYLAMGFRPLEEFPNLWDPGNPCLQLIKKLQIRLPNRGE